jgi:hypothetical protein
MSVRPTNLPPIQEMPPVGGYKKVGENLEKSEGGGDGGC